MKYTTVKKMKEHLIFPNAWESHLFILKPTMPGNNISSADRIIFHSQDDILIQ